MNLSEKNFFLFSSTLFPFIPCAHKVEDDNRILAYVGTGIFHCFCAQIQMRECETHRFA